MTSPMHSPLQSPLQPVMRSPLEFRRRGGFNIASTNPSAYYDRSVLASMFQDSAGTIAIPDSGYSIGYGGDLSGGGNNQIQATAGKRPILMQSPAGGVRNLLTYTEDFGNAQWSGANLSVGGAALGPTGKMDATTITNTAGGYRLQFPAGSIGPQFTGSIWVRRVSGSNIVNIGSPENVHTPIAISSVWQKFTRTSTSSGGGTSVAYIGFSFGGGTGDVIEVAQPQLELGSTATDYQKVTNQYTVTEEGVPSVWRAKFDAVDDDLGTTFGASLGSGCTVCRSLPGTGASITTGVTLTATYTDNVDAHALLIYTAAQWAALDAGQIAKITAWLNAKAGV